MDRDNESKTEWRDHLGRLHGPYHIGNTTGNAEPTREYRQTALS